MLKLKMYLFFTCSGCAAIYTVYSDEYEREKKDWQRGVAIGWEIKRSRSVCASARDRYIIYIEIFMEDQSTRQIPIDQVRIEFIQCNICLGSDNLFQDYDIWQPMEDFRKHLEAAHNIYIWRRSHRSTSYMYIYGTNAQTPSYFSLDYMTCAARYWA